MTGMQSLSGVNSCILVHQSTVRNDTSIRGQQMMLTTGAITKSNYTDSKSGKVGDFHHTFGFVIVEIKDDETFLLDKLLPMINLVILVTYITEFLMVM
jgi:hypothetical protein